MEQTSEQPLSRREAEEGYRRLRMAMIWAMLWSFVIAGLIVLLNEGQSWAYAVAAAIVLFEVVSTPLWIAYFRRRRNKQIRRSEAALGKLTADA